METPSRPDTPSASQKDRRRPKGRPRRASDRRLVADLEGRLRFEQLLTDISSTFVDVAFEQVDAAVADALGRVAAFLGADLATVMQIDERGEMLRHTHEWWDSCFDFDGSFLPLDLAGEAPWLHRTIVRGEPVAIHKLEDFPPEAENERRISEKWGIRSVLWVPFRIAGEFLGCVALNTLCEEMTWSAELIQRVQLVGHVFGNAIARKRQQLALDEQLRFEQLLSDLSSVFVSLSPSKVDAGVEDALRRLGGFFGVDRAFILQFSEESARYGPTHGWYAEGIEPDPFLEGAVFPDHFPWMAKRILGNEAFVFQRLEDLPPEAAPETEYVQRVGIRASVLLPLAAAESVLGAVILDFMRAAREWSDDLVQRLRLVGEIFANALVRRRAEEERTRTLAEVQRLKKRLEDENVYLRHEIELKHRHEGVIGKSPGIKKVLEQVELAAETGTTVLVTGETGTGKEVVARAIHNLSARSDRPLVKVNCAALPPALVEAELFGREEGAYTGAVSRKVGRFEIADGATILLDEIGELSLEVQAKLLHVLEDREFQRLGGNETIRVDARVIVATNRDLDREVREGRFREDLYHRLNVFPIHVPPVRERPEDIPLLVRSFVRDFNQKMGRQIETIANKTMKELQQYDWPGNVREIRNVIERAMIRSYGASLRVEIPTEKRPVLDRELTLAEAERAHILRALEKTGGRVFGPNGAAKILDINPKTLHSRMKKLGIREPRS